MAGCLVCSGYTASVSVLQDTYSDDICLKWHLIKSLSRYLTNLYRSLSLGRFAVRILAVFSLCADVLKSCSRW